MFSRQVYQSIRQQAKLDPFVEICGYIKGDSVFQCNNISEQPKYNFLINPVEIFDKNPECIYHSHPSASSKPSRFDIISQREMQIPFLIYSLRDDDFYFLKK
jgi:proteasome lid subunit RPN8/RPN11|tara:strand:+ start:83 stop:388 length:306 start_codon:yes stop_codon:yes gene_type:complete